MFASNFMRFFSYFYKFFFHGEYMPNTTFQIVCYLLPDLISFTMVQLSEYNSWRVEHKKSALRNPSRIDDPIKRTIDAIV